MGAIDERAQAGGYFARGDWAAAFAAWTRVGIAELTAAELDQCATATELVGRHDAAVQALQRAFVVNQERGDLARSVRCAFRLAMSAAAHGEPALSAGWVARAEGVVAELDPGAAECGWVAFLRMFRHLNPGAFTLAGAAADEAAAATRPSGIIGLSSWTPEGFIGQLFAAMKPYAPPPPPCAQPPPPCAQPPPLWGSESHLADLFGDRVHRVTAEKRDVVVDAFDSPEGYRDFFKECYGPAIAVYKSIAANPARVADLDAVLADLGRRHYRPDGTSRWEYLLYTARRA